MSLSELILKVTKLGHTIHIAEISQPDVVNVLIGREGNWTPIGASGMGVELMEKELKKFLRKFIEENTDARKT